MPAPKRKGKPTITAERKHEADPSETDIISNPRHKSMADPRESDEWAGPLTKRDVGLLNKNILSMKEDFAALLRAEMADLKSEFRSELNNMQAATNTLSSRIDGVITDQQQATTSISHMEAELHELKATVSGLHLKCEDLENRSRRYNVRLKFLKEGAEGQDLTACVKELFKMFCNQEIMDRMRFDLIHRVGYAGALREGSCRDVLVKPHDMAHKVTILKEARAQATWDFRGSAVQIFQDVAPSTLARRRSLRPITEELVKRQLKYRWLHPFGLACGNATMRTVQEGEDFLKRELDGQANGEAEGQDERDPDPGAARKTPRRRWRSRSRRGNNRGRAEES